MSTTPLQGLSGMATSVIHLIQYLHMADRLQEHSHACCPRGHRRLVVIQLQAHAVLNFVVSERDVVFVDVVPFLYPDLVWPGASLGSNKLLKISNRVIFTALQVWNN